MDIIRVLTLILGSFLCVKANTEDFECYSCSYTLSADPTSGYACVNSTQSIEGKVSCNAPKFCYTKALFQADMRQVRSVVRNCLPDQQICTGDVCCNRYGAYPTCQQKCTSELCNDIDVETWRDDETSTACVILPEIMTLLFACTLLVLDALY